MNIDDYTRFVGEMDGVLVLRPQPGDGFPEVAWGDVFFYYAPDGTVPKTQPFATIVTKDYPDDRASRLDRPDTFRVNISVGAVAFRRWMGQAPRDATTHHVDASDLDTLIPHPVYAELGWLAVVNPGERTAAEVAELSRTAHGLQKQRFHRRANVR